MKSDLNMAPGAILEEKMLKMKYYRHDCAAVIKNKTCV